jgi:hypothetical protein
LVCAATVSKDLAAHTFSAILTNHLYNNTSVYFGHGGLVSFDAWWVSLSPCNSGFKATSNRAPTGWWELLDYTTGTFVGSLYNCNGSGPSGLRACNDSCEWTASGSFDPTHVYVAVVVSPDSQCPPNFCDSKMVLQSNAAMYPPPQPVLPVTESRGGQNPAEPAAQVCVCDPVNVATGEFFETQTDLTLAGKGPGLGIERTYSSAAAVVDGPLGFGWSLGYGMALRFTGTTSSGLPQSVAVVQENGSIVTFAAGPAGLYVAPLRVLATLGYDASSRTWTFTRHARQIMTFDSVGRLTTISDLHANTVTLAYIESMELSHEPIPHRDGGTNVVPRWPQDHAAVDPLRRPGY